MTSVIRLGKAMGNFTAKELACFIVKLKTYSPKFKLPFVPI
ncbi:hypothetical protein A2U01_0063194, partial [Trifolium medium]|nr:hypothetical protein [Trifolium medium]